MIFLMMLIFNSAAGTETVPVESETSNALLEDGTEELLENGETLLLEG